MSSLKYSNITDKILMEYYNHDYPPPLNYLLYILKFTKYIAKYMYYYVTKYQKNIFISNKNIIFFKELEST